MLGVKGTIALSLSEQEKLRDEANKTLRALADRRGQGHLSSITAARLTDTEYRDLKILAREHETTPSELQRRAIQRILPKEAS